MAAAAEDDPETFGSPPGEYQHPNLVNENPHAVMNMYYSGENLYYRSHQRDWLL